MRLLLAAAALALALTSLPLSSGQTGIPTPQNPVVTLSFTPPFDTSLLFARFAPGSSLQFVDETLAAAGLDRTGQATMPDGGLEVSARLREGSALGRSFQSLQVLPQVRSLSVATFVFPAVIGGGPTALLPSRRNFSTRAHVRSGEQIAIGGLIVEGPPRIVTIRVLGPSLAAFGVTGPLADPKVALHGSDGTLRLTRNDLAETPSFETSMSVAPPPANAQECYLTTLLDAGGYTIVVSGADGGEGVALLEVFLDETQYAFATVTDP